MTTRQEEALPGGAPRLVRDRLTGALDTAFVTWGWFLYAFSPTVPLLAVEQGVSRGVAGLHGTAIAVGTVATGLVSERVTRMIGRRRQVLLGISIASLGVVILLIGPSLAATLTACVVAAIGGNLTLAAAQTALLAHHGPTGPAAITEGHAYATAVGLLAPLALGATVAAGYGWRPAVAATLLPATLGIALVALLRGDGALGRPVVEQRPTGPDVTAHGRLGRTFQALLWAMVAAVAIEFATTFWASELIRERAQAPDGVATAAVAALLTGMTVSRFATPSLTRRFAPEQLLLASYAIAGCGWLVLWLATTPPVAIAGLLLAGVGYGTQYPLAIALVVRAAGARPDLGQARALLATGAAAGLSPFLLGAAADLVGTHLAFLFVPVMLVVATVAVLTARSSRLRSGRAA